MVLFGLVLFWWSIVLRRAGEVGYCDVRFWHCTVSWWNVQVLVSCSTVEVEFC